MLTYLYKRTVIIKKNGVPDVSKANYVILLKMKMDKKNIYLTETLSGLMAGERIKANSFKEAENKCPDGYRVIGKFICEIDAPEFDNINLN